MNARAHDQVEQFQTNRDQERDFVKVKMQKSMVKDKLMIRSRSEEDADN